MYVSLASNIINVIGNCIGVFVLHAGVAGVAIPSLIARAFSAIVITNLCFRNDQTTYYTKKDLFAFDTDILRRVLSIVVPNGIEKWYFSVC